MSQDLGRIEFGDVVLCSDEGFDEERLFELLHPLDSECNERYDRGAEMRMTDACRASSPKWIRNQFEVALSMLRATRDSTDSTLREVRETALGQFLAIRQYALEHSIDLAAFDPETLFPYPSSSCPARSG